MEEQKKGVHGVREWRESQGRRECREGRGRVRSPWREGRGGLRRPWREDEGARTHIKCQRDAVTPERSCS